MGPVLKVLRDKPVEQHVLPVAPLKSSEGAAGIEAGDQSRCSKRPLI